MHDGRRGSSLQKKPPRKEGVEIFLTVNRVNTDRKGVLLCLYGYMQADDLAFGGIL